MPVTTEQFVQQLTASGLMTKAELDAFRAALSVAKQPKTGEDLARELMRAGKLTKYQATAVVNGKIKGLRFGEYVVLDKLGAGGMGVVLKAQHRRMKREVAIKVLPAAALKQQGAIDRFYREVQAAAKLTHPNIVAAYDAGEHEGMHYLVMEYVEGRDLSAIVHASGPMPVKKAVECVLQAARGLAYSHEHGVVHRDIKPANLLLANDGTLKILDMGLARLRDDGIGGAEATAGRELTQSGQIMGTVDYMSPEQADDTRKADARADIYSLGCTLYRIVSGTCPFDGDTMMQKLMAHREKPIPSLIAAVEKHSPGVVAPGLLEGVNAVFQKMLAKLPEERQQTMGEVVAELEAAIAPPKAAPPKRAGGAAGTERGLPAMSDGGEFAFLSSPSAVKAPAQVAPAVTREETVSRQKPESETGDNIPQPPARDKQSRSGKQKRLANQKMLLIGLGGGAMVLALLGVFVAVFNSRPGSNTKPDTNNAAVAAAKPEAAKRAAPKSDLPIVKFPQQPDVPVSPAADLGEWSKPVNLGPVVNTAGDEFHPWLAFDGLSLWFGSTREGSQDKDIWFTTRKSVNDSWETPRNAGPRVNSIVYESYPALSADGLDLYFTSNRGGIGNLAIWTCRRPSVNQEFGERFRVAEVGASDRDEAARISADGLTLVFDSVRPGGSGGLDIWWSARKSKNERFSTPQPFDSAVNSSAHDGDPVLSADNLTLIFASTRPGGYGGFDLWRCERRSISEPFGPAVNLGPAVNTASNEGGPTLSADGRTLIFQSNRSDSRGQNDLWMCTRKGVTTGGGATAPYAWPKDAPPPAIAPFNEAKAKEYQEAWAKHLGVKVEFENSIGMKFRLIPPGEFEMGSPDSEVGRNPNEGRRRVKIKEPFYLGTYEVTQAEYARISEKNPSHFSPSGKGKDAVAGIDTGLLPVENLLFDDAAAFCQKMGELQEEKAAGRTYRLPKDWEWEYACRAGTTSVYYSGADEKSLAEVAWYAANSNNRTHPVGEKRPNAFGLFDMHGNVWEWCDSWLLPPRDRVIRGGTWTEGPIRAAQIGWGATTYRAPQLGFRVILSVDGLTKASPAVNSLPVPATSYAWPNDAPAPAIAPFNEAKAREHQEAWAKHLGVKVDFENSLGMKFRLIPPGEFMMGATPEEIEAMLAALKADPYVRNDELMRKSIESSAPRHAVVLTQPIYLGVHEVTQKQYETLSGKNPSRFAATGKRPDLVKNVAGLDTANFPVEALSWIEAVAFCDALARQEGLTPFDRSAQENADVRQAVAYRLPTEAEWEFACRAGTTSRYWNGDKAEELKAAAWTGSNSHTRTHSVGELKPNPFGLCDVLGNVWERVEDSWEPAAYEKLAGKSSLDPYNAPLASSPSVARGGSWYFSPNLSHSSVRSASLPASTSDSIGFRLALPVAAVKEILQRKSAPANGQ